MELSPALLLDLESRATHKEPVSWLQVTEADLLDLASGFVPGTVQAMCRTLLDFADQDRRRAERPYRVTKKVGKK